MANEDKILAWIESKASQGVMGVMVNDVATQMGISVTSALKALEGLSKKGKLSVNTLQEPHLYFLRRP